MLLRSALLALLLLTVWGCASARDAYDDGMELETSGDYPAAADAYITSLERDPSLPNVAGRLEVAGRQAIRQYLDRVPAQTAVDAARTYQAADALVRRALGVGVDLERPATFDDDRDDALAAAVRSLADAARDHLAAESFSSAIGAVEQARAFGPTASEAASLDGIARGAYDGWARADLASGRYRDALGHADAALALGGSASAIDALRADILDAGSLVAAVFPASAHADVPPLFARDLTDVVVDDRLRSAASPSPFVAFVDPGDVRRWDRRRGDRGPDLADSPRRLGEATRDLRADMGAALFIRAIREQERLRDPETETARVRSGGSATYTRRDVELTLRASADVVIADDRGQMVCDETVESRVSESFRRSTFSGDWQTLELGRRARAEFSGDAEDRAREEALARLRDDLADRLAREIASCLDGQVG